MPYKSCPHCRGRGSLTFYNPSVYGGTSTILCSYCGGTGVSYTTSDGRQVATICINPHGNPIPEAIDKGDWIDLRAAETVEMKAGDFRTISLGISMELPEGYEAHVAPRSSTFKKWGILLVNGLGIIDNSYSGDDDIWGFPALAMRDTIIEKGDRIAQFRIVEKQPKIQFVPVESLGNENRGGFGSTGSR